MHGAHTRKRDAEHKNRGSRGGKKQHSVLGLALKSTARHLETHVTNWRKLIKRAASPVNDGIECKS